MKITHDASGHTLAGINPIEYLLNADKRKEWYSSLREVKRGLFEAVKSGSIRQSTQAVQEFRNIQTVYREERVGISALWKSFERDHKMKWSHLRPDLIIELMDRFKELDIFIKDWEPAVNGARPFYEPPTVSGYPASNENASKFCDLDFWLGGAGFFIFVSGLTIIGVVFCVLAVMETPPNEPDNAFVPTANLFAGSLTIYIGVASVWNRGYRKYWGLTLTLTARFLGCAVMWLTAMGVWRIHPRFSKGIVVITPYIINIPFAAFTYVATLSDAKEIPVSRKTNEEGNDKEREPLSVRH